MMHRRTRPVTTKKRTTACAQNPIHVCDVKHIANLRGCSPTRRETFCPFPPFCFYGSFLFLLHASSCNISFSFPDVTCNIKLLSTFAFISLRRVPIPLPHSTSWRMHTSVVVTTLKGFTVFRTAPNLSTLSLLTPVARQLPRSMHRFSDLLPSIPFPSSLCIISKLSRP